MELPILLDRFKKQDNLRGVLDMVVKLCAPVMLMLQRRSASITGAADPQLVEQKKKIDKALEACRDDWCGILEDTQSSKEASDMGPQILSLVLDQTDSGSSQDKPEAVPAAGSSRHAEHIDSEQDQQLPAGYRRAMTRLHDMERAE